MGERLYYKGVGDNEPDQCAGKLIMYSDYDALTCIPFLKGLIAGYYDGYCAEYNGDPEKMTLDDWEGIDGWQYCGYYETDIMIPRYAMKMFLTYYMEDKERQNIYPWNSEDIKEVFDYLNKYEYFTISFGG